MWLLTEIQHKEKSDEEKFEWFGLFYVELGEKTAFFTNFETYLFYKCVSKIL